MISMTSVGLPVMAEVIDKHASRWMRINFCMDVLFIPADHTTAP